MDIFHERARTKTAERPVQAARDEKALVAVRKPKQAAAQSHHPLDEARHGAVVVERETERGGGFIAPPGLDPLYEPLHFLGPAGIEHSIGMEEEQPIAPRRTGTGVELGPPPPRRLDQMRARRLGDDAGFVR